MTDTADDGMLGAAWTSIRDGLRRDCGARLFDRWLKPIALAGLAEDGVVLLTLPSEFMANWVTAHYADRLVLAWRSTLPAIHGVRIAASMERPRLVSVPSDAEPAAPVPAAAAIPAQPNRSTAFDPRLGFDSFVVGDENRVAANAAMSLGRGEMRFTPLFIHGATGQGKTHLLQAIGQAFTASRPGATVLSMSAERFMVEFVSAMRDRDTLSFKARLRAADLLMIDDIQFIAGKGSTQEEFLHTIDEIIAAGGRLVITADRSPQALTDLEGRIQSRIVGGLVCDIRPAGEALRRRILDAKCAALGSRLPDDVSALLARRMASSVRELEGALNRLTAYATLSERTIDTAFAAEVLGEMLDAAPRRLTIDDIQKAVAEHYGMRQSEMLSARRSRAIARPRQVAMYLAKRLTPRSLPEIGRRFGGRDHTTVIHAVKQIDRLRLEDQELDGDVRVLLRQLEN
ncbi:chromosomal replication initiator protein [Sphingomonas jejuensis]|uniref:Chromosomal replication initiator protein DnaA n=1 Tax=Sphingomonas jejuensis TaxID=904715 RepID=A0ABX0XID7_9SPHN|nr:chromosomal replication initiator protein DnaA [Sphingomonas jejuensis]NJC33102.1 chromosomal replication initiator protein [Sphingomonas jejuensis]